MTYFSGHMHFKANSGVSRSFAAESNFEVSSALGLIDLAGQQDCKMAVVWVLLRELLREYSETSIDAGL